MGTSSNNGPTLTREDCEHIGIQPVWIQQGGHLYLINRKNMIRSRESGLGGAPAVLFVTAAPDQMPLPVWLTIGPEAKSPKRDVKRQFADLLRLSAKFHSIKITSETLESGGLAQHGVVEIHTTPTFLVRWSIVVLDALGKFDDKDNRAKRDILDKHLISIGGNANNGFVPFGPENRRAAFNKAWKEALVLTVKFKSVTQKRKKG